MNKESKPWKEFELQRPSTLKEHWDILDFQGYGVFLSLSKDFFIFAYPTGSGKTFCTFLNREYFTQKFPNTKALFITNNSAVLQFPTEMKKFFDNGVRMTAVHDKFADTVRREGQKKKYTFAQARQEAFRRWALPSENEDAFDMLVLPYSVVKLPKDVKLIKNAIKSVLKNGEYFLLVVDEAHKLANPKTATHRNIKSFKKQATKTLFATATMTRGKLEQTWGIMQAADVDFYPTKAEFFSKHCIRIPLKKAGEQITPRTPMKIIGYKNLDVFERKLSDHALRLSKADIKDSLPAFMSKKIYVPHTQLQFDVLKKLLQGVIPYEEMAQQLSEGGWERVKSMLEDIDRTKIRKKLKEEQTGHLVTASSEDGLNPFEDELFISAEPQEIEKIIKDRVESKVEARLHVGSEKVAERVTQTGFNRMALQDMRTLTRDWGEGEQEFKRLSPKTQALLDFIENDLDDEKVVIYTQSKRYLDHLVRLFQSDKVSEFYRNPMWVSSEVSAEEREAGKVAFQTGDKVNVAIINDAGTESINLQTSGVLILMCMPSTGGDLAQLAGRISRIGSKHESLLIVYILTQGSQDEEDYLVCMQQLHVIHMLQGEVEQGLLDTEILAENDALLGREVRELRNKIEAAQKENKPQAVALYQAKLDELSSNKSLSKANLKEMKIHSRKNLKQRYLSGNVPIIK